MGTTVKASQETYLEVDFPCQMRLIRYPFGTYMCNLTLRTDLFTLWLSETPSKDGYVDIFYYKDRDLLDFRLVKVTVENNIRLKRYILILHLAAQPDYHITNSFLPSSLMFLICYLSLFFPTGCFNERIMVSLTALLVLVTLFSSATNSYVRTPYYKLIDVWYVALIVLCFVVVVANALVNCLSVTKLTSQRDLGKEVKVAKRCNTACQVLLAACSVVLVVVFVLFSRDIL